MLNKITGLLFDGRFYVALVLVAFASGWKLALAIFAGVAILHIVKTTFEVLMA